jgi:putative hydrolase of the HAD superfamily
MVLFKTGKGATLMIKAIFFDLFQTLVRYDPPREELAAQALGEIGIQRDPAIFRSPLVTADEFMYGEIARRPLSLRSKEEKTALYLEHQKIMLREAGVEFDDKLVLSLLHKMQQFQMNLVLFDDAAPAMNELKRRGLILGLISNVEQDMTATMNKLELTVWLEIIVTSQDAGANKPQPEIFQEALKQAGVQPPEAIYVGDQYQVDVVGANGAGMKGILIDRTGHYDDINDCLKICSLTELVDYL